MSIYLFNERDSLFHSLCSYMALIKTLPTLILPLAPCFLVHLNEAIDRLLEFWSQAMFSASSFHSMVAVCSFRKRKVADSILVGGFPSQMLASVDNYAHRSQLSIVLYFFHLMVFIDEKFNLKIQGTLFFLEMLNHKYHWKWCILMQILTWRYMLHFFWNCWIINIIENSVYWWPLHLLLMYHLRSWNYLIIVIISFKISWDCSSHDLYMQVLLNSMSFTSILT